MRTSKHIGKTPQERENYLRTIKKLDGDSTVDDSLRLPVSDSSEEEGLDVSQLEKSRSPELTERISDHLEKSRSPELTERISDHFKTNWIGWLVAGVTFILGFFIFNFNRDLGRLEGKVGMIVNSVDNIESNSETLISTIHSQDLKIQENRLKLTNIEQLLKDKK